MTTQQISSNSSANASCAFGILTMIYWYQTGRLTEAFATDTSLTDSLLILLSSYTEWQAWVFIILFGFLLVILIGSVASLGLVLALKDGKFSIFEIILSIVFLVLLMPVFVLLANWSLVTFLI